MLMPGYQSLIYLVQFRFERSKMLKFILHPEFTLQYRTIATTVSPHQSHVDIQPL